MGQQVIIDGNNLLHAMHAHAPLPNIGRETLVRIITKWAGSRDDEVTLVFDGPTPRGGLAKQMSSPDITVSFSAPQTADDVIVAIVERTADPGRVRVVTGDKAIAHAAKCRRCHHTEAVAFVAELFPPDTRPLRSPTIERGKDAIPKGETDDWLRAFGFDTDNTSDANGSD